ncbi:LLM class F420-dependent oxidoreductase [Amycolatopsis sp. GM8]|uniref:LLM class F420-dependent oxidoreductase n=1 Tax=Amycolatopsis sp. GM8 TaxID=2896530 RepID=UPI001F3AD713|nr:LLM class F420-dependent oxidoreductase [Amycolatopsis sp. GM8]
MKIGVLFYVTGYTIDPVTIAKAVEDSGFDSFWVPEHAILPTDFRTPYRMTGGAVPDVYGQMADPFVLLSYIGAATSRIKLGLGVCIVPEHHPLLLAKSVSTLDNFSHGRVIFGVGTGWAREEIELFGTDFDTRFRYTREAVEAMKSLWRDGVASYEGELVSFPSVRCDPRPVQQPHPPVVLGGRPGEALARRVAKWGDGWIASNISAAEVGTTRDQIAVECEKIGRDPSEIEISAIVRGATPRIQDAYEAAGASRLVVALYNHSGTPIHIDDSAEDYLRVAAASHAAPPPTADETLRVLDEVRALAKI